MEAIILKDSINASVQVWLGYCYRCHLNKPKQTNKQTKTIKISRKWRVRLRQLESQWAGPIWCSPSSTQATSSSSETRKPNHTCLHLRGSISSPKILPKITVSTSYGVNLDKTVVEHALNILSEDHLRILLFNFSSGLKPQIFRA